MALASCEALAYKGLREWGKALHNKPETLPVNFSNVQPFGLSIDHNIERETLIINTSLIYDTRVLF